MEPQYDKPEPEVQPEAPQAEAEPEGEEEKEPLSEYDQKLLEVKEKLGRWRDTGWQLN